MKVADKTDKQLIEELEAARSRVAELEKVETERKQVEDGLGQSKEQFQALLDEAPIGVCNTDLKGKITYVNKRFEEVSGYSRQEVVGKNGFKLGLFSAETVGLLIKRMAEKLRGSPPRLLEIQFKCKDGHWIWVALEGKLIRKNGMPVGFQIISRDITERKQAEEALRESEERFRSIVENSQAGIMILDDAYRLIYVNDKLCRISGYSPKEIVGQDFRKFLDEESKQIVAERYIRRQRGEEVPPRYEFNIIHKDGQKRRVEISSAVIKDSAGKVKTVSQILDITERKQAEEALQAEKNKLQSVINSLEYGLTIQDKDYNIIYQNEPLRENYGDRVGEKCYQVYEDGDKVCDGCAVAKAFKNGKSHTSERKVVLPSGEVAFWETTASPIRDARGQIVSCLEIIRNITERNKQEQALADEATRRRILVEQSSDGIVVLDEKGKVYEANQRFAEMLGYTPEEVRKLNVWDWEAEFPRERVSEMIASIGPEGDHFETRHRRKDGTVYDVGISTNGAVIAGHKLIFCVCRDITERKRAEEELQAEKNKLQSVINAMEDGLTIQDKDYNIIYQNELVRELFGDHVGDKCYQVYEGEEKLCDGCPLKKAFKDGKSHTSERRVILPSGEVTLWENTANPIRDAKGDIISCLEINRNITERKQAEEALRDSEEKLRKMFESATDGISVIDLNGVITEVNREVVTMHGFSSRDELVGRSALELVAPRDHKRVTANMRKALKQGTVKGEEYTLLKADGSEFPGELSTSALKDADGKWVGHITISRDITERKRSEQALIEAEEKYKNLVEAVSDMIWETDEEGTFTFVSPRIKDTLGYEVDEVVGKRRTLDFTPKGEAQKWLRRFTEINAKRRPFSGFEITHIHKNGNLVIFETSGTPFFDSNGDFKGFVGINKDITERKQAEEEIERQRAYFQQLFDNSPEGIALLDDADRFVQVNRGFENLFGYRSEELKGRSINEVIVPEGLGEEASALSQSALDNQIRRKETVRKRKDGSLVDVDAIGYPIKFDSQTVGVYAIYSDITERKQAEQALRESQEFSSSLLENSPNPEFVVNPDTSVKYVNPAFEKLTGFSLDEITGIKAPYPWWPTEKREETTAGFKNAMVTGGRRSERVFRKKNGERFWAVINSAPVMHEGKLIYFLVNWLDITERKRAEEERIELEQKAHLASRLASVGEMAAGIAHEINNPLTAVIGFSQLLMDTDLPKNIEEDITVIHKEAQRAASVARNLLTFARKHAPTKQLTNINSIIEGVLKLRAYEQSVSNIRVNTRLASDLPEVMVDHSQMQQVFINIILNAEAAMLESSKGGTLTVTTHRVNDTVRASFTDSGRGIAKENLNRIFDPFFTTKEVGQGTGLGLSVCHGIVAEHGGRIYARSKPGQGATFVVELPINSRSDAGGINETF